MAVLSRDEIKEQINAGRIVFDPEIEASQLAEVSVNLRLGNLFTGFRDPPEYLHEVRVDPSIFEAADLWEEIEAEGYRLERNEIILAKTLERVVIPNDLVGFVEGRSSWARCGVGVHLTAPIINPGWDGTITLEFVNMGRLPIRLAAVHDRPAQLMFFRLGKPLEEADLYGRKEGDIFQYQTTPIPRKIS